MNENENIGFEDFETALFGDDYQFDGEDGDFETEETDDTEDGNVIDDSVDGDADSDDEDEAEEAEEEEEESDEEESEEEPADEAEEEEEKPGDTDAGQKTQGFIGGDSGKQISQTAACFFFQSLAHNVHAEQKQA